jgi:hypothetical protein
MWEYPPMRAFFLDIGAGSITVDQCILKGHDTDNNVDARKSTTVACDDQLAPHLQHQLGGLRSNISDYAFKPRQGGDTWREAEAEIYPPELNWRIAIAMTNAAAARHVAGVTLMRPSASLRAASASPPSR